MAHDTGKEKPTILLMRIGPTLDERPALLVSHGRWNEHKQTVVTGFHTHKSYRLQTMIFKILLPRCKLTLLMFILRPVKEIRRHVKGAFGIAGQVSGSLSFSRKDRTSI